MAKKKSALGKTSNFFLLLLISAVIISIVISVIIVGNPKKFTRSSAQVYPPYPTVSPPTCFVKLSPNPLSITTKGTALVTAGVTTTNGTVKEVTFRSSNIKVVSLSPSVDILSPFNTQATGKAKGSTNIFADVYLNEIPQVSTCTASLPVTIN